MKKGSGLLYIILIGFIMASFIVVPKAQAKQVWLSWTPPLLSCDGSGLTDLAGYVVTWGQNPGGPYPNTHNVDDPSATGTTIDVGSVENTTLYFVSESVDTSGNRSADVGGCGWSNQVEIPFGATPPAPPMGVAGGVL